MSPPGTLHDMRGSENVGSAPKAARQQHQSPTSAYPPKADSTRTSHQVRKVQILLQNYFWGADQKFLEPLMRLAPRDVRDLIISQQDDHRSSY
jgi:hypothetical protein